ncbi:MAG: dihydroxy-acid dehydratase [Paenibacillus sp.]|jgi:dihydroxy-acid dehydratase|nr:dihydroxy-acid dehydratase [Paenibacillus sp.]
MQLRSLKWFDHPYAETKFQHLAAARACGHIPESFVGKPIIGIMNSWNDLNSCNAPHKQLVEYVKRGVLLGGGYPLEFHSITTAADFVKPSDLPYRNLMSMDIEEMIRSMPIDGVVLLCECDKTTPGQLMAAASCDLPAIQLAAGHRSSGTFQGKPIHYGTDLWKYADDYRAGKISDSDWRELESCMSCSSGGCPVMGTASTMKSLSEMLGMMLPGSSSIPANHTQRLTVAEQTGIEIVRMVHRQLTPSRLMTEPAFANAIKLLAALGGSTNAVIHLIAIAGRLGIRLSLDDITRLSSDAPLLVNLMPNGQYSMDDFFAAGGLSAVISMLLPLLDGDALTATGRSVRDTYQHCPVHAADVIRPLDRPVQAQSGIVVLTGNLAPHGAVLKRSASSGHLHNHRGQAIVFDDYEQMLAALEDESLDVTADSVLVLRQCGPVGAGMPEWGAIPVPRKLLRQGVRDIVRITDSRMSGTSSGTIVLHVAPEAAVGGTIGLIENGDWIELDVAAGQLRLDVADEVLQERASRRIAKPYDHVRGFMKLSHDHILQAHEGCDLDFLKPAGKDEAKFISPIVGRG